VIAMQLRTRFHWIIHDHVIHELYRQKYTTLHHPFPQRADNHFIDVTELCLCILYFIFSIATDPSKSVLYFYLKF
jgi:hypothetical protein